MDKKVLMNEILTLLDKVNQQGQILSRLPNMARIDVDLLLVQIRQVYDKTLDLQLKIEISRQEHKTEIRNTVPEPVMTEPVIHPTVHPAPKVEEPVLFTEPEPIKPEPKVDFEYIPAPRVVTPPPALPTPLVIPAPAEQPKSVHQAYEEQITDHSLAAKLQYNPINDLRSAIGINDKFLIMNQLFKGSMEQYNAAIERLNGFYNFEDAEIFLGSLKMLHDWADDLPANEKLLHFVKRRYQKE